MNFNGEFDCYIEILKYSSEINEKINSIKNEYKLYENLMTDFNYILSDEAENHNDENENIYKNKYMIEYGEILKYLSKQTGNNINKNIYFSDFINKYYNVSKENNTILNDKFNSILNNNYDELTNKHYNNTVNENSKILKNKFNNITSKEGSYNYQNLQEKQYNNIIKENKKVLKNDSGNTPNKENNYSYDELIDKYYNNILIESIKVLKNKFNTAPNKENNYSYDELINKYYNNILNENNRNLKKQYNYEKYNIKKENSIFSLNSNSYNDLTNSYYNSKSKENNDNLKYNYDILQSKEKYYKYYDINNNKLYNDINNNKFYSDIKKNGYKKYENEKINYINFILNDLYKFEKSNEEYSKYKMFNFKENMSNSTNKYMKSENIINDNMLYSKQKKNLFNDYKNLKYINYKNEYNQKDLQNIEKSSCLSNTYNKNNKENLLNYIDNQKKLNESNRFKNINDYTQNELLQNQIVNNLYKDYFSNIYSYEKDKKNVFNSYDKKNDNKYFNDMHNYKNYDINSILNRGYNYSLKDYLESINTINTDNDNILISKNILHEDLKYLKDTTDSQTTNKFENKTISPQIQITFGNIEKAADVDEVLNILSQRLQEQFEISAEGLHI